ncbi:unnamed protein product, partial [Symbiodinium sp. CCMP2456]
MPAEPTLLEVTTQVNSERQERHVSPVSVASEYPVWDFNMEFDVDLYSGRPLNVEIKVMSARLFGRRHLFSGSLSAAMGSNDVRRQEISLESAPSIFAGAADTNSQLVVAWQLCDPEAAQPELSRVAESGREAMDKQMFVTNVGLRKCELRTGFDPNKYDVYLRISGIMLDDVSNEADTELVVEDFPAEPVDDPSDGKTKKNKNVHVFRFKRPSQGDSHFSWSLVASKVDLLSYGLRAEAFVRPKTLQADDESTDVEQEETSLGVWKDSLANLDDRIAYRSHQLHFHASLHNKEASTTAKLELLSDIYVDGTEPHDEPVTLSKKPHLDVFTGLMRKGGKQNEQLFYASVAALGLKHLSNPILKVFSAAGVKEATKPSYDEEEDLTTWQDCLAVATSRSSSKVRIEIWSEATLSQPGQLVGQAVISSAAPNIKRWRHVYGAARNGNLETQAELMVRGRLPASTWTASLLVHFTQRPVVRVDLKDAMVKESMKAILKVRLHRGLYLGWYANQNVTVLVQLAGCYQEAKSSNGAPRKNANLLSFPGKVSEKGLLQFVDDTPKGGLFSSQESLSAWVERQTSKVLDLPKDVSHAYLYIVSKGDEDLPPLAWAKFPISVQALNTAQWTPVRFDQSVVKLNGSKSYHEDMAGMLLGSVCIQTGEEEDLNSNPGVPSGRPASIDPVESVKEVKDKPEPELKEEAPVVTRPFSLLCSAVGETQLNVGSRGKVTAALGQVETKKVYIHLDVLAARSLPSGDEDGVPDACYEVKVGDQTALLHDKDPFCSLDPVFMDRLTIGPVEAEVLKGPDGEDELDLPPIVVRVLDKDYHTVSSSFEVLGRAIINNVPLLEFAEDDVPHVGKGGEATVSKLDAFLNKHHAAVWYALNSDLRLKFRRNAFGASADGSWARRPRLLMAAGYTEARKTDTFIESLKKAKTKPPHWCFQQIQTERHACYKIRVDVLGLRYLEAWAGSNENVELEVVPFWKSQSRKRDKKVLRLYDSRTTRFLESSDQNPSFQTATKFDGECKDYMKRMEQLLLFQGFEKEADVPDGGQSAKTMRTGTESRFLKAQPSSTAQEWEKFRVRKDRLLGAGFQAPVHTVPIIPYLQTELDDELGKTLEPDKPEPKEATGKDPSGKDVPQISLVFPELEDDYVLLPDVVIRLRNIDEDKDEGIACLSLPYSGSKLPKEVSKMMQQ